jgi:hypothetical protein
MLMLEYQLVLAYIDAMSKRFQAQKFNTGSAANEQTDNFQPALALQGIDAVAKNLGMEQKGDFSPRSVLEILKINAQEAEVILPLFLGQSDDEIAERNGIPKDKVSEIVRSLGVKLAGREIGRSGIAILAEQLVKNPEIFDISPEARLKRKTELLKEAATLITKLSTVVHEIKQLES